MSAAALDRTEDLDASVIIVSYKTRELTRRCLASVFNNCGGLRFEVLLVDNDSRDGTAEMVVGEFPAVRLTSMAANVGFGRAVNAAAECARGEFLILLNPDTVVLDHALSKLVDFARARPQAGLVGGRTLRPDGRLDPGSCWGRTTLWSTFCFAVGLSAIFKGSRIFDPESVGRWHRDSAAEVSVITGCLLAASRRLWEEIGGFDPDFWMYGEDFDLSWRVGDLGYSPAITPDATVIHEVGASTARRWLRLVMTSASAVQLMRKHWPRRRAHLGVALYSTGVAMRAALGRVLGLLGVARLGDRGAAWQDVWRVRDVWRSGPLQESEFEKLKLMASAHDE